MHISYAVKAIRLLLLLAGLITYLPAHAKPFSSLSMPVKDAPAVVEFFSFYCSACLHFSGPDGALAQIEQRLTPADKVVKYHVSAMGMQGEALTEAWSVALVAGVAELVEGPLFSAVLRDRTGNQTDKIRLIFNEAGVDPDEYSRWQKSLAVRGLVTYQNSLAEDLRITATPSILVRGRYLINNHALRTESAEAYAESFANLVEELISK